jgi:cellulose synthase/poly-beta-1,6-N-acetylglucosamine synthase-like glycosyltransferase
VIKLFFWGAVALTLYPYLIYPLAMLLLGSVRPRPVRRNAREPDVTVLIPAYNEADCIGETVRNKLEQDYPRERLQIIVVSDGSDDGTDAIVQGFADRGVQLLRREGREGKAAALNEAIRHARGEIVVFSDANSRFAPDGIRRMVENFADPEVGYVTGSLQLAAPDGTAGLSGSGGSAYIRYENLVRTIETRAGSIIGVNGGVDAIRRDLYVDIPRSLITDFVLPLHVIAGGRRVVYDPRVVSRETPNEDLAPEFRMRVRVALRALQGLIYMRRLFNPLRYPLTAFCLTSHKLLRYLTFLFLPVALAGNAALAADDAFYGVVLALQLSLYVLALAGLARGLPAVLRKLTVVPSYFLLSNAAFTVAVFRFLRGETMATWKPRAG